MVSGMFCGYLVMTMLKITHVLSSVGWVLSLALAHLESGKSEKKTPQYYSRVAGCISCSTGAVLSITSGPGCCYGVVMLFGIAFIHIRVLR